MIKNDILKKLIEDSASITEEEKTQLIDNLPTTSEEDKQRIFQAFMIEKVLTEKLPGIKQGLIDAFEDIFDKTDQAYKKYERSLIQKNEKKQKTEELKEEESIIKQL